LSILVPGNATNYVRYPVYRLHPTATQMLQNVSHEDREEQRKDIGEL